MGVRTSRSVPLVYHDVKIKQRETPNVERERDAIRVGYNPSDIYNERDFELTVLRRLKKCSV